MEIEDLLAASSATDAFKVAVRSYLEHRDAPAIQVARHAPRVKVVRVLSQLLSAEASLPIESVRVEGTSGCSDFRGTVHVVAAGETKVFDFVWDCQWRAREEGWNDYFGFPDQIRAAREFGWRCFARWQEQPTYPMSLMAAQDQAAAQLA